MKPKAVTLHRQEKALHLEYEDGTYELSAEYLRVFSPSAEVRGHGVGQEVLQTGKAHVGLDAIEPQGRYALKLIFSDGHDSGVYTWPYLRELCVERQEKWQSYLAQLNAAGQSRDPDESVVKLIDPSS